ncbi:GDSL esterase/lipase [Carex littledalei]|uniref:GDSL esterase/lipase n=1 Tax=Carex littledalei TaxID=544730 RepID=A0A833R8H0_9POAL|nr:GDSL esterase/lipase [Carex littledalei]
MKKEKEKQVPTLEKQSFNSSPSRKLTNTILSLMAPGHLRFSLYIPILTILLLSKTGNYLLWRLDQRHWELPQVYRQRTYFGRPTGRFSEGRLILDFIGLSFIPLYLLGGSTGNFLPGVNFAVSGATALNNSFFESMGIEVSWTNYSLGTQLEWFKKLLPSILEEPGCGRSIMSRAPFVVGAIGGNDYNNPLFQGRTLDEVRTFVPDVIRTISLTIHTELALLKPARHDGNHGVGSKFHMCRSMPMLNLLMMRPEVSYTVPKPEKEDYDQNRMHQALK